MGLNVDVEIGIQGEDEPKPSKLGMTRINSINIKHDGTTQIKFNTLMDFLNLHLLNRIASYEEKEFSVYLKWELEIDEDEEEEELEDAE